MSNEGKIRNLSELLKSFGKVLIAFSGGVDSTFLLFAAKQALGNENILAVIAESPTYTSDELACAKEFCEKQAINFEIIQTDEFSDENFTSNPKERCYFCKKELFGKLSDLARQKGIPHVLDGSNIDDKSDFRPGSRAKTEYGVKSPLQEIGFTKQEIRDLSKELQLPTWDKPSLACLASRIPYGTKITKEILEKIEEGEKFLKTLGFKQLRVRHHGLIARIEVDKDSIGRIMRDSTMDKITKKFEELGYVYVTLDLKGYRMGSMNEG